MSARLRPLTVGAVAVGVAIAALLGTGYLLFVFALVVTQVIAALSLNLLMGYAGQVSLGQAAFVGSGAFAAAYLASWKVPFPFTLVVAALVAASMAALAGSPSLRIRGIQVAATTLAFGVMAEQLLFARPWAENSTSGMPIDRPAIVSGDRAFFIFALACLCVILALDLSVRSSRIGRAMAAVRDREDTAAAWGISVGATKVIAYAIAGLYAGIAGALHGYLVGRVTPDSYSVWVSLGYVAIVIVGGVGSRTGVALAAIAFAGLPEILRASAAYAPLAGAVLLMVVPVIRPEGLAFLFERKRRARTSRIQTPSLDAPRRALPLTIPVMRLLVAENIHVAFGGLHVLRGVDLEVRRGEIVGLIGPNGAGKTTLFNCISGYVRPTDGTIAYRGRDVLGMAPHERSSVGIVRTFQHVGLCRPQTVWENVLLAQYSLARYGAVSGLVPTPAVRRDEANASARALAALDLLGCADLRDEVVASLPHGRQRLVEVAAAVAAGPELLMLDEPAAGMDPSESEDLGRRLLALRDELALTMLVIEHHVPLLASVSDHVYVLDDGVVICHDVPAAVQRDPRVLRSYLGEPRKEAASA